MTPFMADPDACSEGHTGQSGDNNFSICYDRSRQIFNVRTTGRPLQDNSMRRCEAAALALFALLILSDSCCAQRELFERIKKVTDVPIWQRVPLGQKEFQKALKDVRSTDRETMQDALKQLALSRPLPAYSDLTVGEAQNAAKRTKDKFAMAMAFEIKRDWTEAKKAAETLKAAQRAGGFRALEQVIARGNAAQASGPMIAVAYSGNPRAALVLAQYWLSTGEKARSPESVLC